MGSMLMTWTDETIKQACLKRDTFREMLGAFDKAYWEDNVPLIDDHSYNRLREEYISRFGDDLHVGASEGDVTLLRPMLSIDNVFDRSGLEAWCDKKPNTLFVMEPKIDGLAIRLIYTRCDTNPDTFIFTQALTRATGGTGTDVTDVVENYVDGYPSTINVDDLGLIEDDEIFFDGEVYVPLADHLPRYAGCRQQAAAILKTKIDPADRQAAACKVLFSLYGVCPALEELFEEELVMMRILGKEKVLFNTTPIIKDDVLGSSRQVWDLYSSNLPRSIAHHMHDLPTDGFVVKVNNFAHRNQFGYTNRYVKGAVAIKTRYEPTETKAVDLTWSVTMSGRMCPLLWVEPVIINGSTVTKASLHNFPIFRESNYIQGDPVGMVLAGDIIPDIVDIRDPAMLEKRTKDDQWKFPHTCPGCGGATVIQGDDLYCERLDGCPGTAVSRLKRGVSNYGLEIDGFGIKILEWCKEIGILALYQIFETFVSSNQATLEEQYKSYFNKDGRVVVAKLIKNVEEKLASIHAGQLPLYRVLYALCLPGLGASASVSLAKTVRNLTTLIDRFGAQDYPLIPGVTQTSGKKIHYFLANPTHFNNTLQLQRVLRV